MPWVQVLATDTTNLQKVQDILLGMHTFYVKYTPAFLVDKLSRDRGMQIKIFLYQDGTYDICGITRLDYERRMQMVTGGVKTASPDIQTAADILNRKFLAEMGVYGAVYAYGFWDKDNTALATNFYTKMQQVGKTSGFNDAKDYDLKARNSKVLELYAIAKDETINSVIDDAQRSNA